MVDNTDGIFMSLAKPEWEICVCVHIQSHACVCVFVCARSFMDVYVQKICMVYAGHMDKEAKLYMEEDRDRGMRLSATDDSGAVTI